VAEALKIKLVILITDTLSLKWLLLVGGFGGFREIERRCEHPTLGAFGSR
jgi:hypothetical protein